MEPTSMANDRHETAPNGHRPPSDGLDEAYDRQNDRLGRSPTVRKVTVPEAAEILGTTTDAVRSRMRRGKLGREEGADGTVYVLLERTVPRHDTDGRETVGDRRETVEDRPETAASTVGDGRETVEDGLVEVLSDQVAYLREQLDKEREANRENRRLLAAALERIPAIEPPETDQESSPEPRDGSVTPSETVQRGTGAEHPFTEEERESERPSWWRRVFLGE